MSPRFVLGRENVPCVAEVVNRSLKAFTDFTLRLLIMETISSDLNQKHSRAVLFERDFKLSNCSCKVNFTNSN